MRSAAPRTQIKKVLESARTRTALSQTHLRSSALNHLKTSIRIEIMPRALNNGAPKTTKAKPAPKKQKVAKAKTKQKKKTA